jgi:hypothetical protein
VRSADIAVYFVKSCTKWLILLIWAATSTTLVALITGRSTHTDTHTAHTLSRMHAFSNTHTPLSHTRIHTLALPHTYTLTHTQRRHGSWHSTPQPQPASRACISWYCLRHLFMPTLPGCFLAPGGSSMLHLVTGEQNLSPRQHQWAHRPSF